jgi:hypothetical protein
LFSLLVAASSSGSVELSSKSEGQTSSIEVLNSD